MFRYEYDFSSGTTWISKDKYENLSDAIDFGWHYALQRQSIKNNGTLIKIRVRPAEIKGDD